MRLLLDTHALLWAAHDPGKLSTVAANAIRDGDNQVIVSAVAAMEIATKARKGKLEYETTLARRFVADVAARGFDLLSIHSEHAELAGRFTSPNQDPWDRLLAAQALIEGLKFVTCDSNMNSFDVEVLW